MLKIICYFYFGSRIVWWHLNFSEQINCFSFFIMLAPLRRASLVYYFIIQIQLTYCITDILIHLVQVWVKSSFCHFPLHFHLYPTLPRNLFYTFPIGFVFPLSLWTIWKKKKKGQDLNRRPPCRRERALFIRARRPPYPFPHSLYTKR